MNLSKYAAAVIAVAFGLVYLAAAMLPPAQEVSGMRVQDFGRIGVENGGRVKPLDTLARNSLMVISGREEYVNDKKETVPAVQWLLDVLTGAGADAKVFRIENTDILAMLKLERREGLRYAAAEVGGPKADADTREEVLQRFTVFANQARKKLEKERDATEAKAVELAEHLQLYMELAQVVDLHLVPPQRGEDKWKSLREAIKEERTTGKDDKAAEAVVAMLMAYGKNDAKGFNRALDAYQKQLAGSPAAGQPMALEVFFNHFAPFYHCAVLYVLVFVLCALSWLVWREPLGRAAFWLGVLTLAVHTWALLTRMYLSGRPPVTNLYSSAVFIGWACLVFGLVLEMIYRNTLGSVVASVCGFLTMIVASYLGGTGDTIGVMQAVLDTNFWLATHVVCITLGYAATFKAGFLGIVYVIAYAVLTAQGKPTDRGFLPTLAQMIYGTVCFATLLSFTGTVLGGIWADQSWGRFWGWDPKENGALLIVIWNVLILHARWGGMVKQRGIAVLAIIGNMVTGWSWFGTNQLGVGLHSYGFSSTLAAFLVIFWISQVLFIVIGLLPAAFWKGLGGSAVAAGTEPPPELGPRGRRKKPRVDPFPETGIRAKPRTA